MFKRLLWTFGPFFLVVALFASLQGLGFLDLSHVDKYRVSGISSLADKLRYFSATISNSSHDFDFSSMLKHSSSFGDFNSIWNSTILILGTICTNIVKLGSFVLLGGSVLFDMLNDVVSLLRYFYDFVMSSDITGGLWSTIWKSW